MSDNVKPATKDDLRVMKNEIVSEISEVLADVMQNIGTNFQELKEGQDQLKSHVGTLKEGVEYLKLGQDRLERKLDATTIPNRFQQYWPAQAQETLGITGLQTIH